MFCVRKAIRWSINAEITTVQYSGTMSFMQELKCTGQHLIAYLHPIMSEEFLPNMIMRERF